MNRHFRLSCVEDIGTAQVGQTTKLAGLGPEPDGPVLFEQLRKPPFAKSIFVHSDDRKMTDLNLAAVSPVQATFAWTITPSRAADLLKLCFVTGHKVSAHLTEQSAATTNASIANLRESCDLVSTLINREVFQALGQDHITFELGGAHGSITERPQSG